MYSNKNIVLYVITYNCEMNMSMTFDKKKRGQTESYLFELVVIRIYKSKLPFEIARNMLYAVLMREVGIKLLNSYKEILVSDLGFSILNIMLRKSPP